MAIIRTAVCTICKKQQSEASYGAGWPGWLMLDGIAIDGDAKVMVCPDDLPKVAQFIDGLKSEELSK